MKTCLFFALLVSGLAHGANTPLARHDKLELRRVVASQTPVPRYGALELKLDLGATYENPFDPDEITIQGLFTSPKGRVFQVNGFLDQPFTRRLENDAEKIEAAGDPVWKIKFTPDETGTWTLSVTARDKTGTVSLPDPMRLEVTSSPQRGFIRRSQRNPFGFASDDAKPFFGIGENMCWGGKRGSFDYEQWLPEFSKAGGNFIRIWMCSWNCALEWSQASRGEWRNGDYHGVGIYSLGNAWKLDTILDLAQSNGVYVMLCLGTYGEFNEGGYFNEGQWKANPYNAANGGPCAKPEEFWTNATARKLYQQRLRYLAARYGHRTSLHSWEFWNEAKAPAPWVAEMARFLKGTGEFNGRRADPYQHLVSTTYGEPAVWQIPEIDFTQTHSYGTGNIADHAITVLREAKSHARFHKPHLMAEFGIDWRSPDSKYDPDNKGINLHNALWASVVSGDGGSAMIWWWDNYIHPQRLYQQFTALRRFADEVPWDAGEWSPFQFFAAEGAIQISGVAYERNAVLWLHNLGHCWKNVHEKKEILTIEKAEFVLTNLPSGTYQAQWWDTGKGETLRREQVSATPTGARLTVTNLATDVALLLKAMP